MRKDKFYEDITAKSFFRHDIYTILKDWVDWKIICPIFRYLLSPDDGVVEGTGHDGALEGDVCTLAQASNIVTVLSAKWDFRTVWNGKLNFLRKLKFLAGMRWQLASKNVQ